MADRKKLQPVDLVGIGNLLEHLVAEGTITCEERDGIIARIAKSHGFAEHEFPIAGYGRRKDEVLARVSHGKPTSPQRRPQDESYISLTEIVRAHSTDAPGYVIQSWLRNSTTLSFLNLWEKENNPDYFEDGYVELMEKKKATSFTLTPKLWISQTKAIGLVSKQGKSGGTLAHPIIAGEFSSWLAPEFKMLLLTLSLGREQLR